MFTLRADRIERLAAVAVILLQGFAGLALLLACGLDGAKQRGFLLRRIGQPDPAGANILQGALQARALGPLLPREGPLQRLAPVREALVQTAPDRLLARALRGKRSGDMRECAWPGLLRPARLIIGGPPGIRSPAFRLAALKRLRDPLLQGGAAVRVALRHRFALLRKARLQRAARFPDPLLAIPAVARELKGKLAVAFLLPAHAVEQAAPRAPVRGFGGARPVLALRLAVLAVKPLREGLAGAGVPRAELSLVIEKPALQIGALAIGPCLEGRLLLRGRARLCAEVA
ncbi:MAG: hypothetical protein GVX90_00470, partial [Alphaproteobacteria bacterium]|nr:hypothetical protein [Alphaproteobacteria bacterium]